MDKEAEQVKQRSCYADIGGCCLMFSKWTEADDVSVGVPIVWGVFYLRTLSLASKLMPWILAPHCGRA